MNFLTGVLVGVFLHRLKRWAQVKAIMSRIDSEWGAYATGTLESDEDHD